MTLFGLPCKISRELPISTMHLLKFISSQRYSKHRWRSKGYGKVYLCVSCMTKGNLVLVMSEGAFKKYAHSKFPIFDTPSPLARPCLFYMYPLQHTFALVSYSLLKKSSVTFMNFRMKNRGVKREAIYFFKLNIKNQYFLHRYIYNDNKNIYRFIKKR